MRQVAGVSMIEQQRPFGTGQGKIPGVQKVVADRIEKYFLDPDAVYVSNAVVANGKSIRVKDLGVIERQGNSGGQRHIQSAQGSKGRR